MEEILIKKHVRHTPIVYPAKCLPIEFFNKGNHRQCDDDLIQWAEVEAFREAECAVSHVETLEIPERYLRGIVSHKGQDYVFSIRASLMETMTKVDMTALIEHVVREIKRGGVE